jgi:hypothetical protein
VFSGVSFAGAYARAFAYLTGDKPHYGLFDPVNRTEDVAPYAGLCVAQHLQHG